MTQLTRREQEAMHIGERQGRRLEIERMDKAIASVNHSRATLCRFIRGLRAPSAAERVLLAILESGGET